MLYTNQFSPVAAGRYAKEHLTEEQVREEIKNYRKILKDRIDSNRDYLSANEHFNELRHALADKVGKRLVSEGKATNTVTNYRILQAKAVNSLFEDVPAEIEAKGTFERLLYVSRLQHKASLLLAIALEKRDVRAKALYGR